MADFQLLVVEDDLDHYCIMQRALEEAGAGNIRHFVKGEALLDFLELRPRDTRSIINEYCILLDLGLPGISGEETLARLKARSDWARIPVIILTSQQDPQSVARCHQLGCAHFISKPVDSEKFSHALSQVGQFVNIVELPSPFRKV